MQTYYSYVFKWLHCWSHMKCKFVQYFENIFCRCLDQYQHFISELFYHFYENKDLDQKQIENT